MYICPTDQAEFNDDAARRMKYFCTEHHQYLVNRQEAKKVARNVAPDGDIVEPAAPPPPPTLAETYERIKNRTPKRGNGDQPPTRPTSSVPQTVDDSEILQGLYGAAAAAKTPSMPRAPEPVSEYRQPQPIAPANAGDESGTATPPPSPIYHAPRNARLDDAPPPIEDPRRPDGTIAMRILPGQLNEQDAAAIEQLVGTFGHLPSTVSFETLAWKGQRRLILRGRPESVEQVLNSLSTAYEQIDAIPLPLAEDPMLAQGGEMLGASLRAERPPFLPFKTWREFALSDPFISILGAFNLRDGEDIAWSQVVVHGAAPARWADQYLTNLVRLKRRGFESEGGTAAPATNVFKNVIIPIVIFAMLISGVVWAWGNWVRFLAVIPLAVIAFIAIGFLARAQDDADWANAPEKDVEEKLKEMALEVEVRIFARAATRDRAVLILNQLFSVYSTFNSTSGNRFAMAQSNGPSLARQNSSMYLNIKEIAGLWHLPVGKSVDLVERLKWERVLPDNRDEVSDPNGAPIGVSSKMNVAIPIRLSLAALRSHIFTIGKTRMGKSTFMSHVIAHWMRDRQRAVILLDPHGDLSLYTLGLVPPDRIDDVIYIDFTLKDALVVGLNLLGVDEGENIASQAERLVNILKVIFAEYWGPRMQNPLLFAIWAILFANLRRRQTPETQYTIFSIADLLQANRESRQAFVQNEVPAEEPQIRKYFVEFEEMAHSLQTEVILPVLSKLYNFVRSPIKEIVGQSRSTLHIAEAIRRRKIIIVNVNSAVLGADMTNLVGSLFINILQGVIKDQSSVPPSERVMVNVAFDEFQLIRGTNFGDMLGELAKNGGVFLFGTQSLANLRAIEEGGGLPERVFAGVTTLVSFQTNGEDAEYLTLKELDTKRVAPESVINIAPHNAYIKMATNRGGRTNAFSFCVAPPLNYDAEIADAILSKLPSYSIRQAEAQRIANVSVQRFVAEYALSSNAEIAHLKNDLHQQQAETESTLKDVFSPTPSRSEAPLVPSNASRPPDAPPPAVQREQIRMKPPILKQPLGDRQRMAAALRAVQKKGSAPQEPPDPPVNPDEPPKTDLDEPPTE